MRTENQNDDQDLKNVIAILERAMRVNPERAKKVLASRFDRWIKSKRACNEDPYRQPGDPD